MVRNILLFYFFLKVFQKFGTVIFRNTSEELILMLVLLYVYNGMNVVYTADGLEKRWYWVVAVFKSQLFL